MKRLGLPGAMIVAGILLLVLGVVYRTMFAGAPSHDAAPELAARYLRHVRIGSGISTAGLLGAVLGGAAAGVRFVARGIRGTEE